MVENEKQVDAQNIGKAKVYVEDENQERDIENRSGQRLGDAAKKGEELRCETGYGLPALDACATHKRWPSEKVNDIQLAAGRSLAVSNVDDFVEDLDDLRYHCFHRAGDGSLWVRRRWPQRVCVGVATI